MRAAIHVVTLCGLACYTSPAHAQTWSVARARPALWQISSVDATGEEGWPYGREDVAGDGLASFEPDEAGTDLRTVYADADADELYVRAYVSATGAPPQELVAFFFLDIDERDTTGGDAEGTSLWADWEGDPSAGGYERALGVRGDGTLIGAFEHSGGTWMEVMPAPNEVRVEIDVDRDPIRIGDLQHGYVQVVLDHDVFGLDADCDGDIFVRLWHDGTPQRSFGDDDDEPAACRAPDDRFGDPIVLRDDGCTADEQCPGDGECVEGLCVFGYECTGEADCRSGEICMGNVCMPPQGDACTSDAECDGLVCDGETCVACADSGARACAGDAICTPGGTCLPPEGATPAEVVPGKVRGGAFECAVRARGGRAAWPAWLLLLAVAPYAVRAWRRRR